MEPLQSGDGTAGLRAMPEPLRVLVLLMLIGALQAIQMQVRMPVSNVAPVAGAFGATCYLVGSAAGRGWRRAGGYLLAAASVATLVQLPWRSAELALAVVFGWCVIVPIVAWILRPLWADPDRPFTYRSLAVVLWGALTGAGLTVAWTQLLSANPGLEVEGSGSSVAIFGTSTASGIIAMVPLLLLVAGGARPVRLSRDMVSAGLFGLGVSIPLIGALFGPVPFNELQFLLVWLVCVVTTMLGAVRIGIEAPAVSGLVMSYAFAIAVERQPSAYWGSGFGIPVVTMVTAAVTVLGCYVAIAMQERHFAHAQALEQAALAREQTGRVQDLLDRTRELSAQMERMALVDDLTGLPNRRALRAVLDEGLRAAAQQGQPVVVAFLDLDQFHEINATHGHAGGDAVLVAVARRLKAAIREQDTVARISGDEFVVVCATQPDVLPEALAERLARAVNRPINHGGALVRVTASVGTAVTRGTDPDEVLDAADTAMYRAKARGGGTARTA